MLPKTTWLTLSIASLLFGAPAEASGFIYPVRPNDTLNKIAVRFCGSHDRDSLDRLTGSIATANRLRNKHRIYPGQVLQVSCKAQARQLLNSYAVPQAVPRAMHAAYGVTVHGGDPVQNLRGRTVPYDPNAPVNPEARKWEEFACAVASKDCLVYLAITKAENPQRICNVRSGMNDDNTFDTGFAQMNTVHLRLFPDMDFADCRDNIIAGYLLYLTTPSGWGNWTKFNNGEYRKYLNDPHFLRLAAKYSRRASSADNDD
jgi:hypothetical protein